MIYNLSDYSWVWSRMKASRNEYLNNTKSKGCVVKTKHRRTDWPCFHATSPRAVWVVCHICIRSMNVAYIQKAFTLIIIQTNWLCLNSDHYFLVERYCLLLDCRQLSAEYSIVNRGRLVGTDYSKTSLPDVQVKQEWFHWSCSAFLRCSSDVIMNKDGKMVTTFRPVVAK